MPDTMPDIFTPEQISQILEEFFRLVGTRQYIGLRYVPIFGRKGEDSIEWDNTAPYEPLSIVLYQGNSYTSRQYVPDGVEVTNQEFWAITGNYNAQIEQYRRETAAVRGIAEAARTDINTLLPKADFSAENTVKKYIDDSVAEVQNDIDTLLPKADFSAENTVKQYIDRNKTRVLSFDTVADMQNAIYLESGMVCHTNGFHASGDGGAAWYVIDSEGTPNGKDIIKCGTFVAHLIPIDSYVMPEMFGALGDGVAIDNEGINAAFEYAKANNVEFVMRNRYRVNDTIQFFDYNVNAENSMIIYDGTRTKPAIELRGRSINFALGDVIDYAAYIGSNSDIRAWDGGWHGWTHEGYVGIRLFGCYICNISATTVIDFTVGCELYSNDAYYNAWNTIDIHSIRNCKIGYHILNDGDASWNNANTFNNTDITYQSTTTQFVNADITRYGVKQEQVNVTSRNASCNSNVFNNCYFEYHGDKAFIAVYIQYMAYSVFNNCRYETSGVANRTFAVFDFQNIPVSINGLKNRIVGKTYTDFSEVPVIEIKPPLNTSLYVPSEINCLSSGYYAMSAEFSFDNTCQHKIAANYTALDNMLYATISRRQYGDVNITAYSATNITDDHITTNPTGGCPCAFIELLEAGTSLVFDSETELPIFQLFDADGNQLQDTSDKKYIYAGSAIYNYVSGNNACYRPSTSTIRHCEISFDPQVKYLYVLFSAPILVELKANKLVKITKVPQNKLAYLNYPNFKSNVVPTDTTFPMYTKIWDFRNLDSLGGYWQLEKVNNSLSWVHYDG